MIDKRTSCIDIKVTTTFLENESTLPNGPYRYKYDVKITNHYTNAVQLIQRYWKIEHVLLGNAEVEGEGVIGFTPTIEPEDSFEYASYTELYMPYGKMSGHYTFIDLMQGDQFNATIPAFVLTYPILLN